MISLTVGPSSATEQRTKSDCFAAKGLPPSKRGTQEYAKQTVYYRNFALSSIDLFPKHRRGMVDVSHREMHFHKNASHGE